MFVRYTLCGIQVQKLFYFFILIYVLLFFGLWDLALYCKFSVCMKWKVIFSDWQLTYKLFYFGFCLWKTSAVGNCFRCHIPKVNGVTYTGFLSQWRLANFYWLLFCISSCTDLWAVTWLSFHSQRVVVHVYVTQIVSLYNK